MLAIRRQEFLIDHGLQRALERRGGVDLAGEAGLPQLDRADEARRSRGCAVGEGKVRVLISSTDQFRQCRLAQTVFGGELLPGGRTT